MDIPIDTLKELLCGGSQQGASNSALQVGTAYYIRTVTYHYTGRVRLVTEHEVVLDDAAWIGDSGRFSKALYSGELSEVEPYPAAVVLNRGAIVDASVWGHSLPRETK